MMKRLKNIKAEARKSDAQEIKGRIGPVAP
jgi:hypothetical protein